MLLRLVFHPPLNPLPSRDVGNRCTPSPPAGEGWGEGDQHRNAAPHVRFTLPLIPSHQGRWEIVVPPLPRRERVGVRGTNKECCSGLCFTLPFPQAERTGSGWVFCQGRPVPWHGFWVPASAGMTVGEAGRTVRGRYCPAPTPPRRLPRWSRWLCLCPRMGPGLPPSTRSWRCSHSPSPLSTGCPRATHLCQTSHHHGHW